MKIEVTPKLAGEIRVKHVEAQKSISEFANSKEEDGMLFSIYSGLDVAASAFLLSHLELNGGDVRETVNDFLGMITDKVLENFMDYPHVKKAMLEEATKNSGELEKVIALVTEALKDRDITPIIAGGTFQEIADQMQGMADAEKAPKQ